MGAERSTRHKPGSNNCPLPPLHRPVSRWELMPERAWEPGLDPRQPLSPPLTATPDNPQYGLHSLDGAQDPGGPVGPALVLSAEPSP